MSLGHDEEASLNCGKEKRRKGRAVEDQHTFNSFYPPLVWLNISVILSEGFVVLYWTVFSDRLYKGYGTVISKTDTKKLLTLTKVSNIKYW